MLTPKHEERGVLSETDGLYLECTLHLADLVYTLHIPRWYLAIQSRGIWMDSVSNAERATDIYISSESNNDILQRRAKSSG